MPVMVSTMPYTAVNGVYNVHFWSMVLREKGGLSWTLPEGLFLGLLSRRGSSMGYTLGVREV